MPVEKPVFVFVVLEGRMLREKLLFRADVEPVPEGTLPRFEAKAQPVRKLYEEFGFIGPGNNYTDY